jgi:peptidylprolyl isomerase
LPVKKGDFILIDYTAEVEETGEVFDTTIESVAKEREFSKENAAYEPMLVIVGKGWVLKSLDDALPGLKEKSSSTITIPPEKAFGPRDPKKIRMLSMRSFRKKNVTPVPGIQMEIGGKSAIIRSVGAGRVQVDFNPPLAGRTLKYDVTVKKIIKDDKEKIMALIHRRLPSVKTAEFDLKITKTKAIIEIPNSAFYIEGLQYAKRGIVNDINKYFTNFKTLNFVETFKFTKKATDVKPQKQASDQGDK